MQVRLEFKPQDLWIGVFWRTSGRDWDGGAVLTERVDVWVCLLPCLPIHVWWLRTVYLL